MGDRVSDGDGDGEVGERHLRKLDASSIPRVSMASVYSRSI